MNSTNRIGAPRRIVLISGPPGAGKSTLAAPLAAELELPLFSKDQLKETLVDVLGGPADDLGHSRRLGGAAMEILWRLAACAPAAVLEANFRPHNEYERKRLRGLDAEIVEVYCDCDPGEAARRFAARAQGGAHAAHPLTTLPASLLAEYDGPVGLGTVLRVNTTRPVDVSVLAAQVRDAWRARGMTHDLA